MIIEQMDDDNERKKPRVNLMQRLLLDVCGVIWSVRAVCVNNIVGFVNGFDIFGAGALREFKTAFVTKLGVGRRRRHAWSIRKEIQFMQKTGCREGLWFWRKLIYLICMFVDVVPSTPRSKTRNLVYSCSTLLPVSICAFKYA